MKNTVKKLRLEQADHELLSELADTSFTRTCRIAKSKLGGPIRRPIYVTIRFKNGDLSISGVEGPRANGNCYGGCGQIDMSSWEDYEAEPGVNLEQLRAIWHRWHLNYMQPGTAKQMECLRQPVNKAKLKATQEHYTLSLALLKDAGLEPDGDYHYGSAWLKEDVPHGVLVHLKALPDNSDTYPWRHDD